MTTKSKGIPLTKYPTCGKQGYKVHVDPEDKTSPFYYRHYKEEIVKGKYRTCRDGKTIYERTIV